MSAPTVRPGLRPDPTPPTTPPSRGRARRRAVALLSSGGTALLGLTLLTGGLANPLVGGPAGRLPAAGLGLLLVALAAGGLVALLAGPRLARAAAALTLVGHLFVVATSHLIMLLGYLLAAAVPLGTVVLAVLAVRRYRLARWLVLLGAAAALAWGAATGVLAPATVLGAFGQVALAMRAAAGEQLLLLWLTAGVLVWGSVLAAALATVAVRPSCERWLLRHRTALTLVAAAGPLPYVLVRATWLTPWPQGAPADLDPGIRLWGLLLGVAGLLGSVLTVGLVRPWGSVVPRWVPGAAGRPVPVAAAAVPALVVAVALVVGAVPMLTATFTELGGVTLAERALFLLLFPFEVWGPALLLATWAYVLHRRSVAGAVADDGRVPVAAG